ncbi:pseudouridine synthase [Streptomyces sp. SPB074]|uniref:pseudouridine synthase n=1 Tax=Streptomyces sp. (strain SPB074) TaxID=465543 RepID=UPI00017F1268|nr:pseudouridine synthase [Streptomyces sp. SPB074]EDY44697.1 RNA pseudouridine synthase [Streptomyces sp. SPB074]
MPRRSRSFSPLPQRDGIDAVRLRVPDSHEGTLRAHLRARLPVPSGVLDAMLAAGEFVDAGGRPAHGGERLPGATYWFHRTRAPEPEVPFALRVVHRDERLLVCDKPHFLATTPRGSHITETALARLRRDLGIPALSPAHRLDRLTAGLVLFVVRPEDRGAYQSLFARKEVRKEYEAVAAYAPSLPLPRTVRSHLVKERGDLAAREVAGAAPNSETRVALLGVRTAPAHAGLPPLLARYRLLPRTGRTHQLRAHMNGLGLPLLGDPLYPRVTDPDPTDYRRPLQLLARTLAFTDPLSGEPRRFTSGRALTAWHDPARWARTARD